MYVCIHACVCVENKIRCVRRKRRRPPDLGTTGRRLRGRRVCVSADVCSNNNTCTRIEDDVFRRECI